MFPVGKQYLDGLVVTLVPPISKFVCGPSFSQPAPQLLRSELVELRPQQFSLRLRVKAISSRSYIIVIIILGLTLGTLS